MSCVRVVVDVEICMCVCEYVVIKMSMEKLESHWDFFTILAPLFKN